VKELVRRHVRDRRAEALPRLRVRERLDSAGRAPGRAAGLGRPGPALLAFTVQIYCDISGYSDMALGTAHLLGYKLAVNFNMPYVATSMADYWRRDHISLSTWFRDYLYISLGGNRVPKWHWYGNLMGTFLVSGLGELHLAILIETMRREGYEMQVAQPEVIQHYDQDGHKLEPYTLVEIDVAEETEAVVRAQEGQRESRRALKQAAQRRLADREQANARDGMRRLQRGALRHQRREGEFAGRLDHLDDRRAPVRRPRRQRHAPLEHIIETRRQHALGA